VYDLPQIDHQHLTQHAADGDVEGGLADVLSRAVPLIVIGSVHATLAQSVAAQLRREGNVVYVTHSAEGCLRVATSVAPDMVLMDAAFPPRIQRLLKAHPMSARAQILHLSEDLSRLASELPHTARKVGPHAA
jgi:hypothetical protein